MKHLILCLFLASCAAVPTKPVEPVKTYPVSGWKYNSVASNALELFGKELLAAYPNVSEFCSSMPSDKVAFYTFLLASMSKRESGWDTNQVFVENFRDANGNRVQSTGLLQVSIESCRSYGASAKTTEDLKRPDKNLECGVKILNRWVPKDMVLAAGAKSGEYRGGARYWSVLRPGSSKTYIMGEMKKFCGGGA